jgi:hypothetical protein
MMQAWNRVSATFVALVVVPLSAATLPEVAPAPVADEVLHGCDGHKLEDLLRDRLASGQRFRLAADPEEATLRLEITNCTQQEQRTRNAGTTTGPIFGPAGSGVARGAQTETAIGMQSTQRLMLHARLGSGERFVQVSSDAKDRKLSEAVDSLRKAIDRTLKEKGDWLLGTSP